LQSSSLIAVLAGYALLLGLGRWVVQLERLQTHRQIASAIAEQLSDTSASAVSLRALLAFGVVADIIPPGSPTHPPRLVRQGDTTWLVSRIAIGRGGPRNATLVVRQNISESIRREQALLLLLLVAAGLASLFTSALLRQVLRQGLVVPIDAFCHQLQRITQPASSPRASSRTSFVRSRPPSMSGSSAWPQPGGASERSPTVLLTSCVRRSR
jgi:hypothetical protein